LTVIADSTVLIGLHQVGRLFLLPALFEHVLIPPAVADETKRSVPPADCGCLGSRIKSAWFMTHRIREIVSQEKLASKLYGTVEVDETGEAHDEK